MYKQILVPIDGSDTSNLALKHAIALAKDQHSKLRLFHVVDLTPAYSSVNAPHVVERQSTLQSEGKKLIDDSSAPALAAGIQYNSKCVTSFDKRIYELIDEEAKSWPADLIVIGTHGRRGLSRLFLGSVAEALARISSKPLLLIRGE
jgi:nucleotide-binding universal stress UspA family protein